jgi:hypothetical protein
MVNSFAYPYSAWNSGSNQVLAVANIITEIFAKKRDLARMVPKMARMVLKHKNNPSLAE